MITLRLRSGGFATDVDFVGVQRLAVPVLLGASFIKRHIEVLYPRLHRVIWSTDASMPILSCKECGKRERRRSPRDAGVRLAQRRVLAPRSGTAMLVTAGLAGQVLVALYNRLNTHHRCQTVRGLAVVVLRQCFSVEVANLSDEAVCLRNGTIISTVSPVDDVDCLLVTVAAASTADTVPTFWASSLLSEFPEDPPAARWALGRPAFETLDAVWRTHMVDLFTSATATHRPRFVPLSPADAARGCAATFSVDSDLEKERANPPFSLLPQVLAHITSYPCDLTLVAPRWQHQSWWALARRYCAARVQLNLLYPTFTVAGRTASSPPPVWRVVIFRFEKAHTSSVSAGATV